MPLQTLEGDEEAIGPERRSRLREAIAEARNDHLLLQPIAEQMIVRAREVGVERNRSLEGLRIEEKPIRRPLRKLPPS